MMTKYGSKILGMLALGWAAAAMTSNAMAAPIGTAASGTADNGTYSYEFTITETSSTTGTAELTNTSTGDFAGNNDRSDDPFIDGLAFNVNDGLFGTLNISNVDPTNWTFSVGSGGIQFDWVGDTNDVNSKLAVDGAPTSLSFDISLTALDASSTFYDVFLTSETSAGTGFGGGEDNGQVAVSFQQLNADGQDSDLLASNWEPGGDITQVSQPSTLMLLGGAFLLLGWASQHRCRKRV